MVASNKKYFQNIATIDYCYFILKNIHSDLANDKRSPLDRMIDASTGADEAKAEKDRKEAEKVVKKIIKLKEEINEDATGDKELLEKLISLKAKRKNEYL